MLFRILILLVFTSLLQWQVSLAAQRFDGPSPLDTNRYQLSGLNDNLRLNQIDYKTKTHFKYALLLDLPVEMIDHIALYQFISEWIGTRYQFGGSSKKGTDCSGFTMQLLKEVYCFQASRTVPGQFNQCKPILREELQPGDLLFFHTTRPGLSHVGFYLGNDKFVHSSCAKGVTIDDLSSRYYNKAFRHGGRIQLN